VHATPPPPHPLTHTHAHNRHPRQHFSTTCAESSSTISATTSCRSTALTCSVRRSLHWLDSLPPHRHAPRLRRNTAAAVVVVVVVAVAGVRQRPVQRQTQMRLRRVQVQELRIPRGWREWGPPQHARTFLAALTPSWRRSERLSLGTHRWHRCSFTTLRVLSYRCVSNAPSPFRP
jgi:hypothetical protein